MTSKKAATQSDRWNHWQHRIKAWFGASPLAGDAVPLLLSILVGLVTGVGAFVFIRLLAQIGRFTGALRETFGVGGSIGLMAVAGLITGLIISRFATEAKGHGVPEAMEAIALRRGRIRPRVAIAKIVASAVTIGAGGSAGREGPIVQVGSTVGSALGQWARLSDEQMSMLVAGGAAAGIAATFNAPIAGSMFALEVILGRFSNRYLGMVVISSVMQVGTTSDLVTIYPDDPIYAALRRINIYGIGRLPVVSRDDDRRYLGMVRRADILKAYDVGLARKSLEQQRQRRIKLRNVENKRFIEVQVVANAPMVGHTLSEFPYSKDCLLVSVLRNGQTMIARGSTSIKVGDLITAYVAEDIAGTISQQFAQPLSETDDTIEQSE
jgi:CBS domain-containing protein